MFVINGKKTFARIFIDQIDDTTRKQIEQIVDHPAFTNPISIMPDCHAGKGCVIGFTMPVGDCVVCSVVGVDIGCGMLTCHIKNIQVSDVDLKLLDKVVREFVPSGMNVHKKSLVTANHQAFSCPDLYEKVGTVCDMIGKKDKMDYFLASLGTLGSGNHFISLDSSGLESDGVYLTVHTGSRNFGLCIANYYQSMAKELCEAMHVDLPSGTEYLPMKFGGSDYMKCMRIAQDYAHANRHLIIQQILGNLFPGMTLACEFCESVHNYISPRDRMIRKGAISAQEGEETIIPLNMRDGILLGIGRGNKEWNFSAPHGAGRLMSRTEAKKKLSMADYRETMKDVYTTSICEGTLDEAPEAYKDPKLIESLIGATVCVTRHLKPIYNFKATEEE